jgi:hypothetical protein
MNEITIPPLIPDDALEYFDDATVLPKKHLRTVSMRYCLESIVETVFVHIAKFEGNDSKWNKLRLVDKIDRLKDFFPEETLESIHEIRKVTNKGAHQTGHKEIDDGELSIIHKHLYKVCEWVIVSYIKKYGFHTQSWLPTVLSTLQPIYRISILKELFEYSLTLIRDNQDLIDHLESVQEYHDRVFSGDFSALSERPERTPEMILCEQVLLLIDKLALALLKNDQTAEGHEFVKQCYDAGLVNHRFFQEMDEKLDDLDRDLDRSLIAQDIEQTRTNLSKIIPAIKEEDRSLFLTIFVAIISQNQLLEN